MCKDGICKCGIPKNSKYHKRGCPPKHRRPWILSQIKKEEREAAAADAKWQAEYQEAAAD